MRCWRLRYSCFNLEVEKARASSGLAWLRPPLWHVRMNEERELLRFDGLLGLDQRMEASD